jgi:hypothetical protein
MERKAPGRKEIGSEGEEKERDQGRKREFSSPTTPPE